MVGLIWGKDSFSECTARIYEAYRVLAYGTTKATLTPVMEAFADTLTEAVRDAVQDGIRTSLSPTELFFGRRKK